jgi:hypothetical protein
MVRFDLFVLSLIGIKYTWCEQWNNKCHTKF